MSQSSIEKLSQAKRSSIQEAIPRLQAYWRNGAWLSDQNQYQHHVIDELRKDVDSGSSVRNYHLVDYVAASTISHCFDGWSYLARALESEMAGDPDAARHLGYYAELRAAMSILAGEGVGVFDFDHVIVTGPDECVFLNGPKTHAMAWEALEHWARSDKSSELIFRAITPERFNLQIWFDCFGGGGQFLASTWLRQWGLDLSRLNDDKQARNLVSYRPTAFVSPGAREVEETVSSVTQLWQMCAPGSGGGFPVLDRHLLRFSLKLLFENKSGESLFQAKEKYSEQILSMLGDLSLTEEARLRWANFLTYKVERNVPQLFADASSEDDAYHIDHSKQVLARATLLLRVATGLLANLFQQENSELHSDLNFWWAGGSVKRRLWATGEPPDSFVDLWEDVADALDATHEWIEGSSESECYYSFWAQNPYAAMTLTTSERIFLWGVS